ncbi:MAG: DUF3426 domain-containing protein, partial [Sulfuricella sp.]|nr:DUF3426 domain-containing protein [Sulfuricella sp.]
MAMVTACPACHTRFRVTPEQMDAHGGDVRCGRCAKVFNAHVYLEHELEELQHEGQSRLPFEAPGNSKQAPFTIAPSPLVGEGVTEELAAPSFEEAKVEEYLAQPLQAMDELLPESPEEAASSIPEWDEEALSEPPATAEFLLPEPVVPAPAEPVVVEPAAQDAFVEIEEKPKRRSFFWLWLIGVLLLLASLGIQGVYFFRSDLAAHHPEFKPFLQQFCGVLRCTIRLPANPDLLSIETSNLEADPQQANLVALSAILRNRAKLAQEYPQLELTLTDTQDRMIARRIFTPGEYAKGADLKRGMVPNEEVTVKLYLDLGDLKAAGYR